jgi:hypothetical protein
MDMDPEMEMELRSDFEILIVVIAQQIVEKKGENHDFARTGYVHVHLSISTNTVTGPQSHRLYVMEHHTAWDQSRISTSPKYLSTHLANVPLTSFEELTLSRIIIWGGGIFAPAVTGWFGALQRIPIQSKWPAALAKTGLDQFAFAPIAISGMSLCSPTPLFGYRSIFSLLLEQNFAINWNPKTDIWKRADV